MIHVLLGFHCLFGFLFFLLSTGLGITIKTHQFSHRRTHCHVILTSFSTVSTFSGSMDSIRFICICMKLLSWCRKLVQISDEDVMFFLETESDASVHLRLWIALIQGNRTDAMCQPKRDEYNKSSVQAVSGLGRANTKSLCATNSWLGSLTCSTISY